MLAHSPRVRMIQKWGIGIDSIDLDAVRQRGIALAITAAANASPVAELAIALMLAVYRRIPYVNRAMREGRWPTPEMRETCYQITGKTTGLGHAGAEGADRGHRVGGPGVRFRCDQYRPGTFGDPRVRCSADLCDCHAGWHHAAGAGAEPRRALRSPPAGCGRVRRRGAACGYGRAGPCPGACLPPTRQGGRCGGACGQSRRPALRGADGCAFRQRRHRMGLPDGRRAPDATAAARSCVLHRS